MKTVSDMQTILQKLSNYWQQNAAIHHFDGDCDDIEFHADKKDFSECLLPFANHNAWLNAPQNKKDACLSYAWIMYNMKTVYIECDIVTPACEDILKYPPDTPNLADVQKVIAEALLDEALHTKMSIGACNYIYQRRKLTHLGENNFYLSKWLKDTLDKYPNEQQKRLVRFAVACASETLITDYLDILSKDDNIQNICYEVTKRHALDERSHSGVFSHIALELLKNQDKQMVSLFVDILKSTVPLFAHTEMGEWEKVFKILDFPNYKTIIQDTDTLRNIGIYDNSINKLLLRLGAV